MKPNIGENIKKLRNEKQITQEQLADYLSISYQAISKWENNVTTPDIFLLPKISEYFEVPIDELFKVDMKGYKNKAERLLGVYESTQKKEDFDKADAEFEKLIAENKADAIDIIGYGTLNQYMSASLAKKAERLLKQAIEMGNENAEGQLISLLAQHGRSQESIDKYEKMIADDPDKFRNWNMLVYAYGGNYGDGVNPEKALEIANKGLEKFPNNSLLLNLCGDICRGLKRYDEAFDYWNKSIEQNPNIVDNYYSMAFTYTDLKRYSEAIESWEKVIRYCEECGYPESIAWPEREIAKLKKDLI